MAYNHQRLFPNSLHSAAYILIYGHTPTLKNLESDLWLTYEKKTMSEYIKRSLIGMIVTRKILHKRHNDSHTDIWSVTAIGQRTMS